MMVNDKISIDVFVGSMALKLGEFGRMNRENYPNEQNLFNEWLTQLVEWSAQGPQDEESPGKPD